MKLANFSSDTKRLALSPRDTMKHAISLSGTLQLAILAIPPSDTHNACNLIIGVLAIIDIMRLAIPPSNTK